MFQALAEANPLMNLPYIIDGQVRKIFEIALFLFFVDDKFGHQMVVTQSNACLLFLGRKFNLLGSNDRDLSLIEQCIFQVT